MEGRNKEKRRSFLPTPKSFASTTEVETQEPPKQFSKLEKACPPLLQVGDKVCIGGIKLGELRYYGKTHIAAGVWCGIELYEAEGKHDGEVEGVRYFTCRPGHGIFAPVDKVSKIELVPHDLHGDVIEEETEAPVEDVADHKVVICRPQRRLLPQPQKFVRRDSKEKITVPSKIDEQNEDFDEVDFIDTCAVQESAVIIPTKRSLPKLDSKIRPPSSKRLPELYNEQVCNLNAKDLKQSAIYMPASSANASDKDINNYNSTENNLSSKDALPQPSESGVLTYTKPSRLPGPGPSKLPKPPTIATTTTTFKDIENTMSDNQSTTDTQLTEKMGDKTFVTGNLNKTYNLSEVQMSHATDIPSTTQSSEDSMSGEVKECLSSDHRHFLNLTFDMEGGASPPQPTSSSQSPERDSADLHPPTQADGTFDISHNSSLGVLDVHDSQLNSDLLQEDIDNGLDGEKKSLLNLTDLEKLSKVSVLVRRQDRVASLGDTFEAENAITSTPVVAVGRPKTSMSSFSALAKDSQAREQNVNENEAAKFAAPLKFNLNATYKIGEGRPVEEILGSDTLDWRQEASDGEEHSGSSEEGGEGKQSTHSTQEEEFSNMRASAQSEVDNRIDSITEKLTKLGINLDGSFTQTTASLSAPKPKLPMVDSGISEQGDILTLEQGRMADSCEMRQSVTEEKQNLYQLIEEKEEIQLQADLIAGHLKKERPLSLVSSISADTGKTKTKRII